MKQQFLSLFGSTSAFHGYHPTKEPQGLPPIKYNLAELTLRDWERQGYNVYFTVNGQQGSRREKRDIKTIRALWIEDDGNKHGDTDPSQFPLPPTKIIQSSPGKYHYHWVLESPIYTDSLEAKQWAETILGTCQKFNGDPNGILLTQVLRVPGYINQKEEYDSPVCEVVGGTGIKYEWKELYEAFPQVEIADKESNLQHISTTESFSKPEAMRQIVLGESIHANVRNIAFHEVNKGTPRDVIFEELKEYIKLGFDLGNIDKSRQETRVAGIDQNINSALAKKETEGVEYEAPKHKQSELYTTLPLPIGGLKVLADNAIKFMNHPNQEMATIAALHTVSVFAGGLFRINDFTMSRKRTVLSASGTGKDALATYLKKVMTEMALSGKILNPFDYIGNLSNSQATRMQKDLNEFRVRSYITSEAGLDAQKTIGNTHVDRGYYLNITTRKYDEAMSITHYSDTAKNKVANEGLDSTFGVVVLLSESVPESYSEALHTTDAFINGMIGREEIIYLNPVKAYPSRDFHKNKFITKEVLHMCLKYALAFNKLGSESGTEKNNLKIPSQYTAANTKAVDDMIWDLKIKYTDICNEYSQEHDVVRNGIFNRFAERICVTALILATADMGLLSGEVSIPTITEEHMKWSIAYHEELARALLAQLEIGALASASDRCVERLRRECESFGEKDRDHKFKNNVKNKIVTHSWITQIWRSRDSDVKLVAQEHYNNLKKTKQHLIELAIEAGILIQLSGDKKSPKKYKINSGVKK